MTGIQYAVPTRRDFTSLNIPYPDYTRHFLTLILPATIEGQVLSVGEGFFRGNWIIYPENYSLDDSSAFAWFPSGTPSHVDFIHLTLKKQGQRFGTSR